MFAKVMTVAFEGIEAQAVEVQVQIISGAPSFMIVGLPDKAVAESRERVRGALEAVGLGMPAKRVIVNLAPADLPKEGSHYDLPIALGMMAATGAISPEQVEDYCVIGELSLDGRISQVVGGLPAALGANAMGRGLICPKSSGAEAAWAASDLPVLAPGHILEIVNHFKGTQVLSRPEPAIDVVEADLNDLRDVKGQESAKRALEIAAAGGHNLLMVGAPGSGKSMLASRLPSILPPLDAEEMLEVSMIRSMAGALDGGRIGQVRPFRAPHHSASMAALVGGGSRPQPGEVALAHHGVLFLDELPEFAGAVLDALRQPLEMGEVSVARANHRITYPARFQLVAAMNPCKCGLAFEPGYSCRQGQNCAARYLGRLSGPFLDRIDIQIEMPSVSAADLALPAPKEGSADVRERVVFAREAQRRRFEDLGLRGVRTNAQTPSRVLEDVAVLDNEGQRLIVDASNLMGLSARSYHRMLKVARTLADLEGEDRVGRDHVAEALSYKSERMRPSGVLRPGAETGQMAAS